MKPANNIEQQVLPEVTRQVIVSNECTDNSKVDNLDEVCQQSANLLDSKADINETSLLNDINTIITSKSKPFLKLVLNGKPVKMELDTGSTLTCISKASFEALNLNNGNVELCNERLRVANYQYETASCRAMVEKNFP